MAGITITTAIDTSTARRAMGIMRRLGADPTEVLATIGGVLEASVRNRFDTGRGPGGVPWPRSKRVIKHGGKTLVDRNNLEASTRYVIEGTTVLRVGFIASSQSTKFAYVHQFGSSRAVPVKAHTRVIHSVFGVPLSEPRTQKVKGFTRQNNIPKREMLGVDQADRSDARDALRDLLTRKFAI